MTQAARRSPSSAPNMPIQPAQRIQALPPYLFSEIDRRKREARAAGRDIIDFGVGDPDQPTPEFIIRRMQSAVEVPAHHRYPFDAGSPAFRERVISFFGARYGVKLDGSELLTLIGSKEGLAHLALAVVNPGQHVLVPDPGYPVYRSATLFAGGEAHTMPLTEERGWLPDLSRIPSDIARSAALMYVNYPNNPTGAVAPLSFFEELVDFARRHSILIAQDAAYNEMAWTQPGAASILQVDGAKDVCIEFHSLSKTFNMTGWRLGFAVGNRDAIAALAKIKSNVDSGQFMAIQEAGSAALEGINRPEIEALRAMYAERMETMAAGLRGLNFRVQPPRATFYIWAGVPAGYDSMGVARKVLDEADVVCIPGVGFGPQGEGYVRFALNVPVERIRQALDRLRAVRW